MNPMQAALRKRKSQGYAVEGDHQDMTHHSQHTEDQDTDQAAGDEGHLQGIVAKLSPGQKTQLHAMLQKEKDGSGADHSEQIAKGGASPTEQAKIQNAAEEENANTELSDKEDVDHDLGPGPHVDSDKIAMSMLDTRDKHGTAPSKPRNLGERMRQGIAAKLKGKGKL